MIISAVIAHFVAVISPGPDTAIILREVSKNGLASGFLCSIGIGLGVTIHSILAVYGISLILFSIDAIFNKVFLTTRYSTLLSKNFFLKAVTSDTFKPK